MTDVNSKLKNLRKLMKEHGLKAYIIPSSDPHMSEYVAEHWKFRSWISGFTGSAGTVVVTENESGLWTDGRYYIQAEIQLQGSEIKLFKAGQPGVPTYIEWIESKLNRNDYFGFPGKLISAAMLKDFDDKLSIKGIFNTGKYDLIEKMWNERPEMPAKPVFIHDISYTGLTAKEKIDKVRSEAKKAGADHYLLSSLEDIAWLFNVRGNDVPNVPVTISYALISPENAFLFIDSSKLSGEVIEHLKKNEIEIEPYDQIDKKLSQLKGGSSIALDPKIINCWLYDSINSGCKKIELDDITARLKAVKNSTELANFRNSYIRDGVAMVRFLYWLDKNVGEPDITELTVEEKLEYFRGQQDKHMGPSFRTIAAYQDHGAMMHYAATLESCYSLKKTGLMVLDSGGQYLDGTTDITRTIVLGEITHKQKKDFTLVLKAHIALACAKFLEGATGSNLDILARQPLWEAGLDYKCGTGHGVGYFLSVHEGPQGISQKLNSVKLEAGMIVTNEPGIYREGEYGIRTENVLMVAEDEKTEFGQFMKFETISYCPIDIRGIDAGLLTDKEKMWINTYHGKVYSILSPFLNSEERTWLREMTQPV